MISDHGGVLVEGKWIGDRRRVRAGEREGESEGVGEGEGERAGGGGGGGGSGGGGGGGGEGGGEVVKYEVVVERDSGCGMWRWTHMSVLVPPKGTNGGLLGYPLVFHFAEKFNPGERETLDCLSDLVWVFVLADNEFAKKIKCVISLKNESRFSKISFESPLQSIRSRYSSHNVHVPPNFFGAWGKKVFEVTLSVVGEG